MKKVMLFFGSCELAIQLSDSSITNTARETPMVFFIVTLLFLVGDNNYLPRQCNFVLVREHEIRTRLTKVAYHARRVYHTTDRKMKRRTGKSHQLLDMEFVA